METTGIAAFSEIDSVHFGIRVARASDVSLDDLAEVMHFCDVNRIDLLIARCATTDTSVAQAMEKQGFLLMDTLVYYKADLIKRPLPPRRATMRVRALQPADESQVQDLAAAAFKGYFGHYHADPRLDQRKCDEAYRSWALRSCTGAADGVLVAEQVGEVLGFATLRLNSPQEGEGVLVAVAPKTQGRGIGPALMVDCMHWCKERGAQRMIISTQVRNISAQKVWCRVGFEPSYSYYTFHKWFNTELR
jgi:GNAT superfamily N-acetyltransferase